MIRNNDNNKELRLFALSLLGQERGAIRITISLSFQFTAFSTIQCIVFQDV